MGYTVDLIKTKTGLIVFIQFVFLIKILFVIEFYTTDPHIRYIT